MDIRIHDVDSGQLDKDLINSLGPLEDLKTMKFEEQGLLLESSQRAQAK